jgi:hypothetical protein
MRFKTIDWLALTVVAAGCGVEHGGEPRGRAGEPGASAVSFRSWPDSAPPAPRQLFDRERQRAGGAERLIVHAIIAVNQGEAAARSAMQALADSLRRADTTLAAVRVIGYAPPTPPRPGGEVALSPLGYLEWVPIEGWDSVSTRTARTLHRINVVWFQVVPDAPTRVTP